MNIQLVNYNGGKDGEWFLIDFDTLNTVCNHHFNTAKEAREWAKQHGYKVGKTWRGHELPLRNFQIRS